MGMSFVSPIPEVQLVFDGMRGAINMMLCLPVCLSFDHVSRQDRRRFSESDANMGTEYGALLDKSAEDRRELCQCHTTKAQGDVQS